MFSAKNCSNSFAFNSLWIVRRAKLHRHCKYLRPTSHHQVTDYVYAFNYTCIPSLPVYFYFIHFMSIYVNHTNNTTLQRCISRHLSKMMCDKYNLRYIYPPSPIPHPRCTYREFVTAQYHWKYLIRIHTLQLPCLYDVLQGTGRFLCTIC